MKTKIIFPVQNSEEVIEVWMERPELIFGVTFLKLPKNYLKNTKNLFVLNPANYQKIPVFVFENLVESQVGVPAHQQEDYDFAKKNDLKIKQVVAPNFILTGKGKIRVGKETLYRPCIDAIIENEQEEFLLQYDGEWHFVGGGIESGDTVEETVFKEIKEETGYVNLKIVEKILDKVIVSGFRIPKDKNQISESAVFHVKILDEERVKSEVEEGRFKMKWVKKEEVAQKIEWIHHSLIWEIFNGKVFSGNGILVNSEKFDGMDSLEAREKIIEFLMWREKYRKKLKKWHQKKLILQNKNLEKNRIYLKHRMVVWLSVGQNIGFEENGKHSLFERPVLVLRVFNKNMFIGIPTTTTEKNNNPFYLKIFFKGKNSFLILSQIRTFSINRVDRIIDTVDSKQFQKIKKKVKKILRL